MTVLAVAHRAGNSLAALRAGVEAGADVVECDVHVSRGRLELRHSKSLGPLPWLWDRNPWELSSRSAPPLHLTELLGACPLPVMLDLKGVGRVGVRTAAAVQERPPAEPVLACSRYWPSVEGFDRPVLSARTPFELTRLRRRVRLRPPYGVSLHGSLLTSPVVAELRERVGLVMTWGVDDLETLRRVLDVGVNGVISNSPEVLRGVRAHR